MGVPLSVAIVMNTRAIDYFKALAMFASVSDVLLMTGVLGGFGMGSDQPCLPSIYLMNGPRRLYVDGTRHKWRKPATDETHRKI